jgi:hypothetical protein
MSPVRVTGSSSVPTHDTRMPVTAPTARAPEEMPESQRVTIPSPQPFPRVVPRAWSPGAYRLVDGQPQEDPQSRR